ncbi:MAG: hypothetical protein GY952_13885, partial [Rhodobacteraceae bacterium]|nr:hypothetical protein [Paracoccaceae bacterium]
REQHIQIHHKGLQRALKGLGSDQVNIVTRGMMRLNQTLSWLYTSANPEFVVSNFSRDLQTAMVHLTETEIDGIRRKVLKDVPMAIKGAYKGLQGHDDTEWARWFQEYSDAGGKISFFGLRDIDQQKAELQSMLKDLNPSNMRKGVVALKRVRDLVDNMNMAVENGVRLATYRQLRAAGLTKAKAASAARELTVNFNRRGEWGAYMNSFYLFYNAGLQGSVRMLKAMRNKKVRRIAFGIVSVSIAMDIMNRMIGDEDEDGKNVYDKIPHWVKERNLVIMLPKWLFGDDGKEGLQGRYLKIPLPYGYNVFHGFGQNISSLVFGDLKPEEAMANLATTAMNSFNPIGGTATFLSQISPTISDPFVEIYTNTDGLGRKIMPVDYPGSVPTPDSQKYWSTVNPLARDAAKHLNAFLGEGNEARAGTIDISPETMEYSWNFFFGGPGSFLQRMQTTVQTLMAGERPDPTKVPFVRRVYGEKNRYVDRNLYYDIENAVRLTQKEFKHFKANGDKAAIAKLKVDRRAEFEMIGTIHSTRNALRQLRRSAKHYKLKGRTQQLKSTEKKMDTLMTRARKRYYSLERKYR